ncbi:citrate/2-methylcitrate synthase [Pseudomonas arsenicoxydans]|uniref:citrate/2-methylcitrate synthase n=1 Tax=Pseudomonas arsenicoxydans TaxID=702115 RepID=UPI0019620642|nr:citrate/2-methylcitrate synthase [Pseudomonas arsenicoxydans]
MSAYKVNLRELRFFLWELHKTDQQFLARAPFNDRNRAYYDALLERARTFAYELGKAYQASDRQECCLLENGNVEIPKEFHGLWQRYKDEWIQVLGNDSESQQPSMPPLIRQTIQEMFMGANPAFMTYGGFNLPAIKLLKLHGSAAQKATYLRKLQRHDWDACFCATEKQAGSDLTAVTTLASPLENGEYSVSGEKVYISAGMHTLTENTVYFVLGRINTTTSTSYSLSCLLVPRFWPNPETGALEDNHVECTSLLRKMGLKGCANTQLVFGRNGTTRAVLLGDRKNAGLLQLVPLMNQARMSTAIIGLGLASSAYLHSVEFAGKRLQGRAITRTSDASAPQVAIIEHGDVQRMLLEMKARVEGCRGLLGKLTGASTQAFVLEAESVLDEARVEKYRKLVLLFTPVCKAFVSDQAWKICELAIQVHGGVGYTDAYPVEQNARDVKILSIWEGTNYIQSQDLVRDKLGFGRNSRLIKYFREELDTFLRNKTKVSAELQEQFPLLENAMAAVERALSQIGEYVRAGRTHETSQFFTRFLEMIGLTASAWVLLESACLAERQLQQPLAGEEAAFYRGKVKIAHYFFANILPTVTQHAHTIENMLAAHCSITLDELVQADAQIQPSTLFGGPRTLYRGTNIDGATLEPNEGLWVRGRNLNELIGIVDFATALWLAWFGNMPSTTESQAVDAVLVQIAGHLSQMPEYRRGIEAVADGGAGMVQAAACGFLGDMAALENLALTEANARGLPTHADFIQGLVSVAAAPHFLQAALGYAAPAAASAQHAESVLTAMGAIHSDSLSVRVVDALLVAWHAGFGYITPTVLVPRTAIGTGVTLAQAVAAGFMASGPKHVGAAEEAMTWLKTISAQDSHADIRRAVDHALDQPGNLLFGFGHPLFVQDPRPPHIRALFAKWGVGMRHMEIYDVVCAHVLARKGLRPNIDFITAAALLDLGVTQARWSVGLGLCGRVAAMVAHAIERRDRPAFGVSSKAARKLLATVPAGWL